MPSSMLETLAQGGAVICANARAARALNSLYSGHAAEQGRRAWQTPQVLDWKQWLHTQWMQLLLSGNEARTLLSALQEEVLWNEIVKPGVESRSLIAAGDVAQLAMSAYSLLHAYNAAGYLHRGEWDPASVEPELFRKWAIEIERRCERNRWLCEAKLPWVIADAMLEGRLAAPPAILWNGFDRLTPVDKALRHALGDAGCVQTDLAWQLTAAEQLIVAPSVRDEFEACALWARDQLQSDPAGTIGILLPDVEGARAELDRVFRRRLSEEAGGPPQGTAPFHEFTLGLPLADVPAIAAALILLHWCIEPQQQETITWLMTTSFFHAAGSAASDSSILAEADIKMRKRLSAPELEMGEALEQISTFASSSGGNWAVAGWVRRMRQAQQVFQASHGRDRYAAQWVSTIGSILKEAGWPGDGSDHRKDSIHFQVQERWQRALEEVSALSFSDRRYGFVAFLRLFTSHLRATIFSPESRNAPITITGILESAGRSFDAAWILGATDDVWPPNSRMHPLLPAWLQLETEMTGSSTEQDRLLAASVLDRLRQSTAKLIFSYAKEGKDGAQRPSSMMDHLNESRAEAIAPRTTLLLEAFTDEMAVAWPGGASAGGQDVLKDQAACPFKAFAAKRLCAQELPSLEPGLNAAERGSIVHNTLASLWADERLKDSAHLAQTTFDGTLAEIVQHHIAAAFKRHDDLASTDWERTYLLLEKERVGSLILQWLAYEGDRKPFTIVKLEETENISIDGLELRIRMDRVDETEGGRLLIDYKTGQVNASSWQSDRPKEPQLPIYAVSGNVENLRDVLFAQVRMDDIKYVSAVYEAKPDIFPGNPSDPNAAACFEDFCAKWKETIGCLSRGFQQGIATVTPKEFPETCKHCSYPGLCRVAETIGGTLDMRDGEE